MRRHLLPFWLILTATVGCDNVAFGGFQYAVTPPTANAPAVTPEREQPVDSAGRVNVDHPILLAGTRTGDRATLTVVGELDGAGLQSFPDPDFAEDEDRLAELTATGSEWILFAEGSRVGRFSVESAGAANGFCGGRSSVTGIVEVTPAAADAERFLALPAGDAATRDYTPYQTHQHVYAQRVGSLAMAQRAISEYGATWPSPGVLDARKHIQAFVLPGAAGRFVAATFLYQDTLALRPAPSGA